NLALFHNSILWSLAAELIYYTLYPLLRLLIQRVGWAWIFAASYALAYAAVLVHPSAKDYSPYGVMLNWLVALPCWLWGCRLAEVKRPAASSSSLTWPLWGW